MQDEEEREVEEEGGKEEEEQGRLGVFVPLVTWKKRHRPGTGSPNRDDGFETLQSVNSRKPTEEIHRPKEPQTK